MKRYTVEVKRCGELLLRMSGTRAELQSLEGTLGFWIKETFFWHVDDPLRPKESSKATVHNFLSRRTFTKLIWVKITTDEERSSILCKEL